MSNNYSPKSSPKPKNNEPCTNASSSRKKTIFKAPASHLKFRNHLSWNTTKTLSRGQSCGSKRPSRVVTRPNPENTIRKMKKKSVVYSKVKRNDNLTYFNVSFIIRNEKKNDENCFSIEWFWIQNSIWYTLIIKPWVISVFHPTRCFPKESKNLTLKKKFQQIKMITSLSLLNIITTKYTLWTWSSIMQKLSKRWDWRLPNWQIHTNLSCQRIWSFTRCTERVKAVRRNQIYLRFQLIRSLTRQEWKDSLFILCGSSQKTTFQGNS